MSGRTEIVIYFDHTLKNNQRIQTGPLFEGKVKDVVDTVYPNWYAFDSGNGRLVYNPANKTKND